ncbi:TetR/AcrR family transcriptional regulator [Pikeienuella piscinae]|uniref:TetR/AcrR family transcriptional regulator n=1 Tax=Pikeienuella piscinae TaxID=2748098 RepID=A0A7L5BU27_9RHOB|nr:TetR/AcrR family transcriptional regulator [Pikeienuella piscinae]QIE54423.1 TetR/AcrR family transcriptional regulator [Pikeienuella piscinae]
MAVGHHRKKRPDAVRAALLTAAEDLAREHGLRSVTMQAVSDAAGVTKGGLLHHYPNRDALLRGLFEAYIARLEHAIADLMIADETRFGRFTRAYIRATLDPVAMESEPASAGVLSAFMGDPGLRKRWYEWLASQEAMHAETDSALNLRIARLAADGFWFAQADGVPLEDERGLRGEILRLANPANR